MSDQITLIDTTMDMFDDYFKMKCDETDMYWNGYASPPNEEGLKKVFESRLSSVPFHDVGDRRIYFIHLQDQNKNIGFMQLRMHSDAVELGYSILQPYQGRGYGTKGLELGVKRALEHGKKVFARIRDDNIPSQRIALKNGFIRTDNYELVDYPSYDDMNIKFRVYLYSK